MNEQDETQDSELTDEELAELEREREEAERQLTRDYYEMTCGSLARGNGW